METEYVLYGASPTSFPVRASCFLGAAILLEVIAALCMRASVADVRLMWVGFPCYILSLALFPAVLRDISLTIAYATWSAVGLVGVTVGSMYLFGDVLNLRQGAALVMIILGVITINV